MFLNPLMLLGIAAVSIPIVIHLLNKRKFKKVKWAAMRFIQLAVKRNQRRLQIEDLLLLMLRCAMVALLAIVLARPVIRSAAAGLFGGGEATVVLIVDNSYSMTASDGVQPRFEQAKFAAHEILNALPVNASAAIFVAADGYEPVIAEPTYDLNLARRTIDELSISDRSTNLLPALRAGIELLDNRGSGRGELYLITDAQQAGWRQMEEVQRLLEEVRQRIAVRIVLVGSPVEQNVGISDLRLASGLAPVDQPLRFEVQVTNHGFHDATSIRVTLRVNDDLPSDEALIDRIPAGEARSISLFARLRGDTSSSYHSVTASLATSDALPADDTRTIAVRALTSVNVLLVDGNAAAAPLGWETFFLEQALKPVPPVEQETYFIRTRRISPIELDSIALDPFDVVVLANVPDVSTETIDKFAAYLRHESRGLIIFPGADTLAWSFNERMFKTHAMLPAALGEAIGDPEQDRVFVTFSADDLTHPVARLWSDPRSGSVSAARFYRYFQLQPDQRSRSQLPPEAGAASIILRFSEGSPAMMERDWGRGKVVLFASTAGRSWTDLPVRPGLYVPLVHRIVGSSVQRQDEHLNLPVGVPFHQQVGMELLRREVQVFPPGSDDTTAVSRTIELIDGAAMLSFTATGRAGAYRVELDQAQSPMLFAAQRDPSESNLQQLTDEQIRALSERAQIVDWGDGETFSNRLATARTGTELWLPLAVLVLLMAVVETFIAQWFSRSR